MSPATSARIASVSRPVGPDRRADGAAVHVAQRTREAVFEHHAAEAQLCVVDEAGGREVLHGDGVRHHVAHTRAGAIDALHELDLVAEGVERDMVVEDTGVGALKRELCEVAPCLGLERRRVGRVDDVDALTRNERAFGRWLDERGEREAAPAGVHADLVGRVRRGVEAVEPGGVRALALLRRAREVALAYEVEGGEGAILAVVVVEEDAHWRGCARGLLEDDAGGVDEQVARKVRARTEGQRVFEEERAAGSGPPAAKSCTS